MKKFIDIITQVSSFVFIFVYVIQSAMCSDVINQTNEVLNRNSLNNIISLVPCSEPVVEIFSICSITEYLNSANVSELKRIRDIISDYDYKFKNEYYRRYLISLFDSYIKSPINIDVIDKVTKGIIIINILKLVFMLLIIILSFVCIMNKVLVRKYKYVPNNL